MVTLGSLWLAIVLSSVLVWIGSAIVWMALPHHKKDYASLADEEAAREALSGVSPGVYTIPHADSQAALKDPEHLRKLTDGPVGYLTVVPNGPPAMGGNLIRSFLYYLFISFVVAYLASNYIASGAEYMDVFRFVAVTAWLGYGLGVVQDSIWFGKPWSHSFKHIADAFLYGLLTAGVFGWLWP